MDREHYLAALLLPPAARDATFALRAFNIEVAIVRCVSLFSPLFSLFTFLLYSLCFLSLSPSLSFGHTAIWLSSRLRGICGISSGETSPQRCSSSSSPSFAPSLHSSNTSLYVATSLLIASCSLYTDFFSSHHTTSPALSLPPLRRPRLRCNVILWRSLLLMRHVGIISQLRSSNG